MEPIPANAATKAYNNGIKSAHLAHLRTLRNTGLYFVLRRISVAIRNAKKKLITIPAIHIGVNNKVRKKKTNVAQEHTKDILAHKRYFFSSAPNAIISVPSGRDILGATVSAMDEWIDNGLEKQSLGTNAEAKPPNDISMKDIMSRRRIIKNLLFNA